MYYPVFLLSIWCFYSNICCIVPAVNHSETELPFHRCPLEFGSISVLLQTVGLHCWVQLWLMAQSWCNQPRTMFDLPLSWYRSPNKSSNMGKSNSNVVTPGHSDLSVLFQHLHYTNMTLRHTDIIVHVCSSESKYEEYLYRRRFVTINHPFITSFKNSGNPLVFQFASK